MISLDPDMGGHDPEVLRKVAQTHKAFSGVYCAVLAEGVIAKDDPVEAVDW
jgi:MOSC domain-containing protein YiiM